MLITCHLIFNDPADNKKSSRADYGDPRKGREYQADKP